MNTLDFPLLLINSVNKYLGIDIYYEYIDMYCEFIDIYCEYIDIHCEWLLNKSMDTLDFPMLLISTVNKPINILDFPWVLVPDNLCYWYFAIDIYSEYGEWLLHKSMDTLDFPWVLIYIMNK